MDRNDLALLWGYDRWAWDRVLAQVALVTAEEFERPARVPRGSLRGTLVHALGAAVVWRLRWQGESPTALLTEEELPTFAALRERWETESGELERFVATVPDCDLSARVGYRTTRGVPQSDVLWQLMLHVINHGTQHRSEAALLVTDYGHSPGDLDLSLYLREPR